jgi:uncharacterized protein (DUF433 family)
MTRQQRGREIAPGIWSTPDVHGGDPCVGHTRIAVWVLEQYRRGRVGDDELITNHYPGLTPQDLANAWAYADAHQAEIDERIAEEETGWPPDTLQH